MLLNFSLLIVQGLVTKYINKLQSDELIKIFQHNDLILLTEIWIDDFQLNRTDKKRNAKRDSGGIALYIKSSLMRQYVLLKKKMMI